MRFFLISISLVALACSREDSKLSTAQSNFLAEQKLEQDVSLVQNSEDVSILRNRKVHSESSVTAIDTKECRPNEEQSIVTYQKDKGIDAQECMDAILVKVHKCDSSGKFWNWVGKEGLYDECSYETEEEPGKSCVAEDGTVVEDRKPLAKIFYVTQIQPTLAQCEALKNTQVKYKLCQNGVFSEEWTLLSGESDQQAFFKTCEKGK